MKQNQNNKQQQKAKNCGNKNCGNKDCQNEQEQGGKHSYRHGGNND